jgi:nucleoside-diphosphate-sugar epimerase
MNIILLGYSGLIGSYILKDLTYRIKKKKSSKIICVSRNIENKPSKNKKIRYVKWDFLNFSKSNLFFFEKKNIIINCTGKNSVKSKYLKEINVIFIKKLLDYIHENKISARLIHLGSVGVYSIKNNSFENNNIIENSKIRTDNLYSKSKLQADIIIKNFQKINKKFSYTILRVANVFSHSKNSNIFRFIRLLLKKGIWFKCSNYTRYHFIHAKDIAFAVSLCLLNTKISRNKIYIVSDDNYQSQLHEIYSKKCNRNLLIIPISLKFIRFIMKFFFLPQKIQNLFFTISSEINYDSSKIKKDLNFKTSYSLKDKII